MFPPSFPGFPKTSFKNPQLRMEAEESPVERARKYMSEGWVLSRHVVKGRVYARLKKGGREISLGPWIPDFDKLLDQVPPRERKEEGIPKRTKPEIEPELRPLLFVFWSGVGLAWFSILFFAAPCLFGPLPSEFEFFIPHFIVFCFLSWLSTVLIKQGLKHPSILMPSGALSILVVGSSAIFWGFRSSLKDPRFLYSFAYFAVACLLGLWCIRVGRRSMVAEKEAKISP